MGKSNQKLRGSFVTTRKISQPGTAGWQGLGRMTSHGPFQATLICDSLTAEPPSVVQMHNKRSTLIQKTSHHLIQTPHDYC